MRRKHSERRRVLLRRSRRARRTAQDACENVDDECEAGSLRAAQREKHLSDGPRLGNRFP